MKSLSLALMLLIATGSASAQERVAESPEPAGLELEQAGRTQATDLAAPRVRVTTVGKHITGRLIAVDADAVTILPNANRKTVIQVPLLSVSVAALSEGKRSRAVAVLAGIGAGVGATVFGFLLGLTMCGDTFFFGTCSESAIKASQAVGVASGTVVGVAVAYHVGRERWQRVPVGSLVGFFASPKP